MAWKDLSIAQRSQLMNIMRHNGISSLSEMRRLYDLNSPSLSSLGENTFNMQPQAPVYAEGGNKPPERRKMGEHYLTLEQYKELQRDTIRQAALQKALTRTSGVAPIINGKPDSSCIYTFTDNYGKKYQVAGTQAFAANPEKYGFEVAGPVTEGMEGNMYLQLNEFGVPYHATMITGYDKNNRPLVTYSQGHAGGRTSNIVSREDWERLQSAMREHSGEITFNGQVFTPSNETYEEYVARVNRSNSPEADYKKNQPLWPSPSYETYRFIGTPDDNALWEQQFNELQQAPTQVGVPQVLNNQVTFGGGGEKPQYNGEIRQGKKWNFIDHYLADNPQIGHGFRKAGTLLNDAMRVMFGRSIHGVELAPRTMTDYGDLSQQLSGEYKEDSAVDRMSKVGTPASIVARNAQPVLDALNEEVLPWAEGARRFAKKLRVADRIVNMGQFIDDFATPVDQFAGGGHKIHIKKANRGKFTALKKRTGHSASWFKAHGTPAQKKMAIFALNAKKWKHAHGGIKF